MKKLIAIVLSLVVVVACLAGCGSNTGIDTTTPASETNEAQTTAVETKKDVETNAETEAETEVVEVEPQELVVGCTSDMGSLFPFGAATPVAKTKRVMLYETLFWQDGDGELQPVLARNYEKKGNGTYEIELFDYITDSEGNKMTAEDIIFTLDLYVADGSNSATLATLKDYRVTGDYTLEVTFDPETPGQFENLVSTMTCVTKAAWESSPDEMTTTPVGTSGYVYNQDESILGSLYVFDMRDDYWQTDEKYICERNKQNISRLIVKIITDASSLAIALESGEIDFSMDIGASDRLNFADDSGNAKPGYIKVEGPGSSYARMTFNCGEDSPCQDIKLREAICRAIDAASCNISINGAFGYPCFAAIYPGLIDSDGSQGNGNYFEYDPEQARKLLGESSYNNETIRIAVHPTITQLGTLVEAYLEAIGIDVELLAFDFATYSGYHKDETGKEFDIDLCCMTTSDMYVYRVLSEFSINTYSNGKCHTYTYDEKLQELYDACANVDTVSVETAKKFLDYIEENVYQYGVYYSPRLFFGKDCIKEAPVSFNCDALFNAFVVVK